MFRAENVPRLKIGSFLPRAKHNFLSRDGRDCDCEHERDVAMNLMLIVSITSRLNTNGFASSATWPITSRCWSTLNSPTTRTTTTTTLLYSCQSIIVNLSSSIFIQWPWPWPWFNPHPSGCIGPYSDAILVCQELPPLLLPRWASSFADLSWLCLSS